MKKNYIFLLIIIGLNACKFEDATVGAADSVVGKYTIKNLKDAKGNFNLPNTTSGITISGTIEVIKLSPSTIDIKMNIEQKSASKTENSTQTESKIDVKKSGSTYNLEKDGKPFGSLKDKTLVLDFIVNKETTTVTSEKN
jgi:hypothetical protein